MALGGRRGAYADWGAVCRQSASDKGMSELPMRHQGNDQRETGQIVPSRT